MTQQEFYNLPDVKAQIEIQKMNPYGSDAHKAAHKALVDIARIHKLPYKDEY